MKIKINPEYAKLVPPMQPREYEPLKEDIKNHVLQTALIVNQRGTLLDGHNRYRAVQELKMEPRVEVKKFADLRGEMLFVMPANLRRDLNDSQKIEIALRLKPVLEELAKGNESPGEKDDRNLTPRERVNDRPSAKYYMQVTFIDLKKRAN